jgi:hypothetical protein
MASFFKQKLATMKNSNLLLMLVLLVGIAPFQQAWAQSPESINYQAAVRDNGVLLVSSAVEIRFTVLDGTATSVYQETHQTTTNDYGLVNLELGTGVVVSGSFGAIDWGEDAFSLQVEMRSSLGAFTDLGTLPFVSVPYSFYADKAGTLEAFPPAGGGPCR